MLDQQHHHHSKSAPMMLKLDENIWRLALADRFAVIVDASDYFTAVRSSMMQARRSIVLIGWDFDTRTNFKQGEFSKKNRVKSWAKRRIGLIEFDLDDNHAPANLGEFVLWLADTRPDLEVRLLRWSTGALKSLLRPTTLWMVLKWHLHKRITLKLDSQHPLASSHHQKIVVIDNKVAFCGGIDVTSRRWDTREHLDDNPHRIGIDGKGYPPWHDAACVVDGDAAAALGDLARGRWFRATSEHLPNLDGVGQCWPENVTPQLTNVAVGISRSSPKFRDFEPIYEIEQAWLAMIAGAKKHVYIENQYFASPKIAKAIAQRLIEADPPEFIIIGPMISNGWLEPMAMDSARARLIEAIKRLDHRGRFRLFHPKTAGGANIYVHAKVMIVDDCYIRVGSSNINNRSMRLDTECDVIVAADSNEVAHLMPEISALRNDMLAEHLGCSAHDIAQTLAQTGSLSATIDALNTVEGGKRYLVPYQLPKLSEFQTWLADNEVLDPNGTEEVFEVIDRPGLFKGWGRLSKYMRRPRSRR